MLFARETVYGIVLAIYSVKTVYSKLSPWTPIHYVWEHDCLKSILLDPLSLGFVSFQNMECQHWKTYQASESDKIGLEPDSSFTSCVAWSM
jgi:hypothetical protein